MIDKYFPNVIELLPDLLKAFEQTIVMVVISFIWVVILGVPLGVLLVISKDKNFFKNTYINKVISTVTDMIRATPTIILITAIAPFTMLIVKTNIGVKGAIVPIVVAAIPFLARQVESVILRIDKGVIEAAKSMGTSKIGLITRVLIPESISGIVYSCTITLVSLINFSTIAGTVGGGGLGNFAQVYGYQRNKTDIMWITVLLLIILVMCIQFVGKKLATKLDKS